MCNQSLERIDFRVEFKICSKISEICSKMKKFCDQLKDFNQIKFKKNFRNFYLYFEVLSKLELKTAKIETGN